MIRTLVILGFLLGTPKLYASALPEVGQRVYVIEKGGASAVSIRSNSDSSETTSPILKDPTLELAPKAKAPKPAPPKPAKLKPKVKKSDERMVFKPARIDGSLRNPRVEFQREYLPVGMAEESYEADFLQKVGDPLLDTNF